MIVTMSLSKIILKTRKSIKLVKKKIECHGIAVVKYRLALKQG